MLSREVIYGMGNESPNPDYSIKPLHWSADGRYLYLGIRPCCGDGGCPAYGGIESLVRLDLASGEQILILEPEADFRFYTVSFSEDDRYLAYFEKWLDHPIMNLRNLATDEEREIALGQQYTLAGEVVWSPDQDWVVFSARTGEACDNMVYYLVKMRLDDLTQTVLLEGADVTYTPVEWTQDNMLRLYLGWPGAYGVLDMTNLEITFNPTPTP